MDIQEGKFHLTSLIFFVPRNKLSMRHVLLSCQICEIADICCNGRVVSVLEGGYGRTPPPIPPPPLGDTGEAEALRQPLEKSFFSECAINHLKGLIDPYCGEK